MIGIVVPPSTWLHQMSLELGLESIEKGKSSASRTNLPFPVIVKAC